MSNECRQSKISAVIRQSLTNDALREKYFNFSLHKTIKISLTFTSTKNPLHSKYRVQYGEKMKEKIFFFFSFTDKKERKPIQSKERQSSNIFSFIKIRTVRKKTEKERRKR